MIIKFSTTEKIPIDKGTIWDYPMPNEEIGISLQELNGRGPNQGQYLNKICHEIYFIISGQGNFYIGAQKHSVQANDVIIIEPNTAHYIETDSLKYITITRPNWYEEQYEEVS